MAIQIQLQSTNYNGQLADITFYPCSGGSINLGYQIIPFTYTNDDYEGTYDLFFSAFSQTCQLIISCPTPTPSITPTVTPTVSLTSTPTTQTPTPTNTTTPSTTPSPYYVQNLRTGGYYQDVCQSINQFGGFPANVTVYSAKPFRQLTVGDHVYGNREFSIPPVGANFTISDGVKIIQISGTLIINAGVC